MLFRFAALFPLVSLVAGQGGDEEEVEPIQQPALATYTPYTSVTDHAAIDLDQEEIVGIAYNIQNYGMEDIEAIYTGGGNSMPYASIDLLRGLNRPVAAGVAVRGADLNGNEIQGATLMEAAPYNASTLKILYPVLDSHADPGGCRVGSLFHPTIYSCFPSQGTLIVDNNVIAGFEDHDAATSTFSGRTIQSFSTNTNLHHRLEDPAAPVHHNMGLFAEYYGTVEYADDIVQAAVAGTDAGLERGNMDFAGISDEGKATVATEATVLLHLFMMVIRQLEHSIALCEESATGEDLNDSIHALDAAVAFYTGSRAAVTNKGHLLYFLAEIMCERMDTCGIDGSNHNTMLFTHFRAVQDRLLEGECEMAQDLVEDITQRLFVPIVQGVLYYGHRQGEMGDATPRTNAAGAVYAAAVLPRLHWCDAAAADTVYQHMKLGNTETVDFSAVKRSLERNLDCMAMTCADVGDIEGTAPCGSADTVIDKDGVIVDDDEQFKSTSSPVLSGIIGAASFFAAALAFFMARCCVACVRRKCCSTAKEVVTDTTQLDESEAGIKISKNTLD